MKIKVGQKCRYIDPFGKEQNGVVISTDNGQFTVCEPLDIPPQYNDSFMDFTDEDIGTRVWFDGMEEET